MRTTVLPFISALKPHPTPQYAQVVMRLCSGWPNSMMDFSCKVAVGQASTQAPQDTHSLSINGWSWPGDTRLSKPRPEIVRAKVPWVSSQARTQRLHTMHLLAS